MPLVTSGLTTGIAYLCLSVGATGQYSTACNKAGEATVKQTGTYQLLDDGERRTMVYATGFGEDKLGKKTMEIGGAGVFLYKVYKDKSVTFKLPNIGIADTMSNKITLDSYTLNVGWKF